MIQIVYSCIKKKQALNILKLLHQIFNVYASY